MIVYIVVDTDSFKIKAVYSNQKDAINYIAHENRDRNLYFSELSIVEHVVDEKQYKMDHVYKAIEFALMVDRDVRITDTKIVYSETPIKKVINLLNERFQFYRGILPFEEELNTTEIKNKIIEEFKKERTPKNVSE